MTSRNGYDPVFAPSNEHEFSLQPIARAADNTGSDVRPTKAHPRYRWLDTSSQDDRSQEAFAPSEDHSPPSRRSTMKGSGASIALACFLLLLPLVLSAVLCYLIYANLMPKSASGAPADFITKDGRNESVTDEFYYVNYSATQLVFISSLASTLSLALIPATMALFSYMLAHSLQRASAAGRVTGLPTPYQFELSIRLIKGGILDFWRYVMYVVRSKRRKVPASAALHRGAALLGFSLLLAIAITVVDALLHIKTASVQYTRTVPSTGGSFLPSRSISAECLDPPNTDQFTGCNYGNGGSGANPSLSNATQSYLALGNASTTNFIQLASDGKTSIIVPANPPSDTSYTAQSFASATTCETVMKQCNPFYDYGGCDACQVLNITCTSEGAGLNYSANTVTAWDDVPNNYLFKFYDSAKKENDTGGVFNGQIWSGVLIEWTTIDWQGNVNLSVPGSGGVEYDPNLDLIKNTRGTQFGVFNCNTTLSSATYSADANGHIEAKSLVPMNQTAGEVFYGPFHSGNFGIDNLNNDIVMAGISATDKVELAYKIARAMDRSILGLASGNLPSSAAVSMFTVQTTQVAQVPVSLFVALIVLELLLPVLGITLSIWAFVLSRRPGVSDIQTRLGIGALVAGLFEDAKLNASASSIEELYAELRGLPTRRVWAREPADGVNMFGAVDDSDGALR